MMPSSIRGYLVALLNSDSWIEAGQVWDRNPEERKAASAYLSSLAPMEGAAAEAPLTVDIEGGQLVIRIGVSLLAHAAKHDSKLQVYAEDLGEFFSPEITDETAWARGVARALKSEEEDGTTLVHVALDKAAVLAIESGADGILTAEDVRDQARAHRDFPPETPL